jgi:hypothetical protein
MKNMTYIKSRNVISGRLKKINSGCNFVIMIQPVYKLRHFRILTEKILNASFPLHTVYVFTVRISINVPYFYFTVHRCIFTVIFNTNCPNSSNVRKRRFHCHEYKSVRTVANVQFVLMRPLL